MNTAGKNARRLGESRTLRVLNDHCLGYLCFDPQVFISNRGGPVFLCGTKAREICPDPAQRGYSERLRETRERNGWRIDEE